MPHSGCMLPEIDPSMLVDLKLPSRSDISYVGRGSFGIVKVQKYRGILVAVKEYLPIEHCLRMLSMKQEYL